MSEQITLKVALRDDEGKGASRRLRRDGKVPAILYGGKDTPRNIALDSIELAKHASHESFASQILTLKVGNDEQDAIIKDIQRHPAKETIMHIDFQRIVRGEKIRMTVPLHFVGGDVAPGVKLGGGIVSQTRNEVDITCLPKDLPEYLEVDISQLELDQMLYMSDIPLPEGVEIPELALSKEHDQAIVSVHVPKVQVIEEEVEVAAEGEEGEEVAAEGEAPAAESAEADKSDDKGDS